MIVRRARESSFTVEVMKRRSRKEDLFAPGIQTLAQGGPLVVIQNNEITFFCKMRTPFALTWLRCGEGARMHKIVSWCGKTHTKKLSGPDQ